MAQNTFQSLQIQEYTIPLFSFDTEIKQTCVPVVDSTVREYVGVR